MTLFYREPEGDAGGEDLSRFDPTLEGGGGPCAVCGIEMQPWRYAKNCAGCEWDRSQARDVGEREREACIGANLPAGFVDRLQPDRCPHCGGITDDAAGGPCSLCWGRLDEAEAESREPER